MKLPRATPDIVTVHAPVESSVQLASTVPTVVSDEVNVIVPDGIIAGVVVSATLTVQDPVVLTVSEAGHETEVDVVSRGVTVNETVVV